MAFSKKTEFSVKDQRVADLAKMLAHPARIAILRVLAQRGTCICGEIVELLPLAQSTVSKHLKDLKEAGLIQGEIDGPKSCYCIQWEAIQELQDLLGILFTGLEKANSNKCC